MSNSDNVTRKPASTRTGLVLVSNQERYYGEGVLVYDEATPRRAFVAQRASKREMAQSGSGRKAQIAEIDAQEQMRDALLSPAYEGPVGTPKSAWVRDLLSTTTYASGCTDLCCNTYVAEEAHEVKVAGLWRSFVRSERQVEPVVKVQPVVSRTARMLESNVDRRTEYDMREIGFGGRYGIHLEG